MKPLIDFLQRFAPVLGGLLVFGASLACARSLPGSSEWRAPDQSEPLPIASGLATRTPFLPLNRDPGEPILTPTPDAPHPLPTLRSEAEQYVVQPGDTLGIIAQRYGVSLEELIQANANLANPNLLEVGQVLTIPAPDPQNGGPDFKIIPNSELVYGPAASGFDLAATIQQYNGSLANYREEVEERELSGIQIVQRIAEDFSLNPRLLLAVLEYQSGWLTQRGLPQELMDYPMGLPDTWRKGLYKQLAWAANNLNRGYYLWRVNGVSTWVLSDGSVVPVNPMINAGTAGVQHLFAQLYGRTAWEQAVTAGGLFATYQNLFGYPFDYAIEPLLPFALQQPPMQLPFEPDVPWAFTGGPHGGWGDGSAWAALDFAPPSEALGCIPSEAWVTAVADGIILRAGEGAVIQDLDSANGLAADGLEQTEWVVLYMHIETRDRVSPGTRVQAGDRIGHPSCEGGFSSGTHVHLARRYNGEWIPADQTLPFVLGGWVSRGAGIEYDGFLERNGHTIEAWEGRSPDNQIQR